jgi:hypothetical protein
MLLVFFNARIVHEKGSWDGAAWHGTAKMAEDGCAAGDQSEWNLQNDL